MDRFTGTKEYESNIRGRITTSNKSSDFLPSKVNRSSSRDGGCPQMHSSRAPAAEFSSTSRLRRNSFDASTVAQQTFGEGRMDRSTKPVPGKSVSHTHTLQLPPLLAQRQKGDHASSPSRQNDRQTPSPPVKDASHGSPYVSSHKPLLALSPEERVPPPRFPPSTPQPIYSSAAVTSSLCCAEGRRATFSPSGVEAKPAVYKHMHGQPALRAPSNAGALISSIQVHTQPAPTPGPPVEPPRSIPYSPAREKRRTTSISLSEQRTYLSTSSSSGAPAQQSGTTSSLAPFPPNPRVAGSSATTKPVSSALPDDQRTSGKEKTMVLTPDTAAVRGIVAIGLKNLGNTCYMNAVIQVLRHIGELNGPLLRFCDAAKLKPDSILKSYGDLVREMQDPGVLSAVNPRPFKTLFDRKCPRFSGYDQQDATEFMRLLINEMHEEWKSFSLPPPDLSQRTLVPSPRPDLKMAEAEWLRLLSGENTKIAECFMGMYKSTIKCQTCSNEAVKFESFWDLSVPFPQQTDMSTVQLDACLHLFTKEETLDGDEKPYCEKCSTKRTSVKQLTLQKQPTVIVIVLKRFAHTRYGTVRKIETTVSVPITLDMNKYASNTGSASTKYALFAVVNHVGTDHFGHYTAWCKNNLEWNKFNDSIVTKAPPPEVCIKTKDAYALFYRPLATDAI